MQNTDPRVTAYIHKAPLFAQPILNHIRQAVHQVCPAVTETIKWGFPHFEHNGIICSMAAFKKHCTLNIWKAALLSDPHGLLAGVGQTAMGQFGQLKAVQDLPPDDVLLAYLQEAVNLNQHTVKVAPKPKPAEPRPLPVPAYFTEALHQNEAARRTFEKFSFSNKKEYVNWVTEAKTEATRQKRLATALEWMAEGKVRNWKYLKQEA